MAKKDYSAAISTIQKVNDNLCKNMTLAKLKKLTEFTPEGYKQYLYKYCKGRQVIYTNADIFLKEDGENFLKYIKEDILKTTDDIHSYQDKNGRLFIWLDKSAIESEDFIEEARKLTLDSLKPVGQKDEQAVIQLKQHV